MTQISMMRALWACLAVVLPFVGRRRRHQLALDASVWLDARSWPLRDPRGWWAYRRRYGRLLRAVPRHGFCIEA